MRTECKQGLVLWLRIDNVWHFIAQASLSADLLSLKIDPLRGGMEGDETPAQTASREAKEESASVFDISPAHIEAAGIPICSPVHWGKQTKLHHVKVSFTGESDLQDLCRVYSANRQRLHSKLTLEEVRDWARESQPWEECVSIAVERADRSRKGSSTHLRFAAEISNMLRNLKESNFFAKLQAKPTVLLRRQAADGDGIVTFKSAMATGAAGGASSCDHQTPAGDECWWYTPELAADLASYHDEQGSVRSWLPLLVRHINEFPDDYDPDGTHKKCGVNFLKLVPPDWPIPERFHWRIEAALEEVH
jgi:ADP-ribose pyrophosphatase YjhB (NUDIX family)